jgi:hypothetical protein
VVDVVGATVVVVVVGATVVVAAGAVEVVVSCLEADDAGLEVELHAEMVSVRVASTAIARAARARFGCGITKACARVPPPRFPLTTAS